MPCVVDLATMREAIADLGGDPTKINPLAPAELVIDHSVIADVFGTRRRLRAQRRDRVRAQPRALPVPALGPDAPSTTSRSSRRAPASSTRSTSSTSPAWSWSARSTASCGLPRHLRRHRLAHHDGQRPRRARLGRRRHRGRGRDARPAGLDAHPARRRLQADRRRCPRAPPPPTSCSRSPRCCASTAWSASSSSSTATGVSAVPLANRATIGNMSPEFGSTCAIFPIDERDPRLPAPHRPLRASSSRSSRRTPRSRACGTTRRAEPRYSEYLELDLSTVVPSHRRPEAPAGPRRADRRQGGLPQGAADYVAHDEGDDEAAASPSRPATRRPGTPTAHGGPKPPTRATAPAARRSRSTVTDADGTTFEIDHGAVAIAAITSLHQHLQPVRDDRRGAARQERRREGPARASRGSRPRWRPAPRSSSDYYEQGRPHAVPRQARLQPRRLRLHDLHRQLRPAHPTRSRAAVNENDLAVVSVLSGNRNFEGRINPDVKMNYLASPAAGRRLRPRRHDGLRPRQRAARPGRRRQRRLPQGHLADARPRSSDVIAAAISHGDVHRRLRRRLRRRRALAVAADARGRHLRLGRGLDLRPQAPVLRRHARRARRRSPTSRAPGCSLKLGDSVTTDHICPAGAIKTDSPAGKYLAEHGVERKDFNSYGSRRGNHEVMIRGTFANIRLRNQLARRRRGRLHPRLHRATASSTTIYDASAELRRGRHPARRPGGQGVRLGLARATGPPRAPRCSASRPSSPSRYERIHRSNLIGMGVLPLQYPAGQNAESLGLTGDRDVLDHRHHRAQRGHDAARPSRSSPPSAGETSSSTPSSASTPPARPTTTATAASCSTSCGRWSTADPQLRPRDAASRGVPGPAGVPVRVVRRRMPSAGVPCAPRLPTWLPSRRTRTGGIRKRMACSSRD